METTEQEQQEETTHYTEDPRVDGFVINKFEDLGYDIRRLPDELVETYNNFKRVKDKLRPGPLSAEAIATVVLLSQR